MNKVDMTLVVRAAICSVWLAFSRPLCMVGYGTLAVMYVFGVMCIHHENPYHWAMRVFVIVALWDAASRLWKSGGSIYTAVRRLQLVIPEDTLVGYFDPAQAPYWAKDTLEGSFSYICGLSRPLEEYVKAWPDVLTWTRKRQIQFADIIVRSMAGNRHWAMVQLLVADAVNESYNSTSWGLRTTYAYSANTATIGNLAWMSLHAHGDFRPQFVQLYDSLTAELKKRHDL